MVDIPNNGTRGTFLKSVGDGANSSYWSPGFQSWQVSVGSASISNNASVTYALVPGLTQTVTGYSNYLVKYDATVANADTGGSHDCYIRLAYGVGSGTIAVTGIYQRTSLDKYSGGSYYFQYVGNTQVISAPPNAQVTIQGWAVIVGASNAGVMDRGVLTILGLP